MATRGVLALAVAVFAAASAGAADEDEMARDDRISELERKVAVLTDELERTRIEQAVPEAPLEGEYGLGPAASQVYRLTRGLHIGGYGELYYQNLVDDKGARKDSTDALRVVLYTGYRFTDNLVFNAEIEFEHGGEEVGVEFAHLDYLWKDYANARAGLLLMPVGFINETHEPPFYFGVNRPEPERRIIPATWRENGVGVFGSLFGEQLEYRSYVVNGFEASGFTPAGLRGGRQNGSEALADHLAWVTRLDWYPCDGLQLGGSVYLGNAGQNQNLGASRIPDSFLTLWELHGQYRWRGLSLRALFTMAHLDDAGSLSDSLVAEGELDPGQAVGSEMLGTYGEVAYDVLAWLMPETEHTLEPFFRVEFTDTQRNMPSGFTADDTQEVTNYVTGISYKPIPNVVIKADYRNRDSKSGSLADEVNLGVGLVF